MMSSVSDKEQFRMAFALLLAFWTWLFAAIPFFFLACLFRIVHWKYKRHKRAMAIVVLWTSIICSVFSAISLLNILWYVGMAWWQTYNGNFHGIWGRGIIMILVSNIIMLTISMGGCAIGYRNAYRRPVSSVNTVRGNNKEGK